MRRLLAALAALLLAGVGALVLVRYVQDADERAQAGEELVPVLVVGQPVPAGTPVDALDGSVTRTDVPARLVATGNVADLTALAGLVTRTDLLPGEQVVAARFTEPTDVRPDGSVMAPPGFVEVSATLDAQRAVNGVLRAGDQVGVYVTEAAPVPGSTQTRAVSKQVLTGVLVTRSSGGSAAAGTDTAAAGAPGATTTVSVTLAVLPADAAAVVAGMEQGTVWLTLESSPSAAENTSTSITTTGGQK